MSIETLFRVQGVQDAEEGGGPMFLVNADARALISNTIRKVKTVSAAYTVVLEDTGTLICVDTACTITLPAASTLPVGFWVDIACIADVIIVIAGTAGEIIIMGDVAANSFTWSTASEKAGASARMTVVSTTKWLTQLATEELQTTTVTT